jgi:hypothetical protein
MVANCNVNKASVKCAFIHIIYRKYMVIVSIFPATVPSTFLKIKTLSDDGTVTLKVTIKR